MAETDDIGDIKRIIFEDTDKRHADLKRKITDSRRLRKKAQEIENKFALNSEEVEDIFDLIEKENQDL